MENRPLVLRSLEQRFIAARHILILQFVIENEELIEEIGVQISNDGCKMLLCCGNRQLMRRSNQRFQLSMQSEIILLSLLLDRSLILA